MKTEIIQAYTTGDLQQCMKRKFRWRTNKADLID